MENTKQLATTLLTTTLLKDISTPIYDALCDLHNSDMEGKDEKGRKFYENWSRNDIVVNEIENCLDYLDVEVKDLKDYTEEKNDFWNDKNKNGSCWCDIRSEYADSVTSMYNSTLWKHASILSEYIEDAILELGFLYDKDRGIIGLLQRGEYYFYEQFCSEVLEALKKHCETL